MRELVVGKRNSSRLRLGFKGLNMEMHDTPYVKGAFEKSLMQETVRGYYQESLEERLLERLKGEGA